MTLQLDGLTGLQERIGTRLGTSSWFLVDQAHIDSFAALTGDEQWIHVDPMRAERESPYGHTVAHGFFTLALLSKFANEIYRVHGAKLMINYGVNRVRFPAPLLAGTRVRAHINLTAVRPVNAGTEVLTTVTFEAETAEKPVCVAETVRLFVPAEPNP